MIIIMVAVLWFGGRCNRGGKAGDGGEASGDAMGCGGMGEKLVDDGGVCQIIQMKFCQLSRKICVIYPKLFYFNVQGLIYSNSMVVYVLTNLVTFLTHIWKLKLKHAVAIMNIKGGATGIMGLVEAALIDAYFGHAGMLLITGVLYSIGVKSCAVGKKLCSSKLTASPFYCGLALIVLAKAGQGICLRALTSGKIKFKRDRPKMNEIKFGFLKFEVPQRKIQDKRKSQKNIIRNTCNIVGTAGGITWVFVSSIFTPDWSHRFLISVCVMAIGIAIFFIGYAFLSPLNCEQVPSQTCSGSFWLHS
ncbi:Protein NRT1/ PTR FAMILY 5.6 [Camellia lanceoleosa]|uniref:Protein NRT1/ PTR FAMILY 5.6 n=1 Tax=Camellia lanceoleosa TaxID=1840588 RepID=A0ACC0F103_9ERIC|nr:Protein NRT1/ PTR FAMILY 5.6 [Camellia lanceoleosa]